jgi:capsular polysaccharide biosynthesis protein
VNDEIDLRQYVDVISRRRHLIGLVTLAALAASAFLSLAVIPPTYEASALLAIPGPGTQSGSIGPQVPTALLTADDLVSLVKSDFVAALVVKRLFPSKGPRPKALLRRVRFTAVRANLLRITARDSSPAGAVATARVWAETIVAYVDSVTTRGFRGAVEVSEARVNTALGKLTNAEKSLMDFEATSKVPVLDGQVQEIVHRIAVYESALEEMRQVGSPISGPVTLQRSGSGYALSVATPHDPAEVQRLLPPLRSQLGRAQAALAAERGHQARLAREVDIARSTYLLLVQEAERLRLLAQGNAGVVSIAVPPVTPDTSLVSRVVRDIGLGAVVGLAAGTALAFAAERFRIRIPSPVMNAKAASNAPPSDREGVET